MAHIPTRMGFSQSSIATLLTDTVSRDKNLHDVERNLSILSLITDDYSLTEAKQLGGVPFTLYDEQYGHIAGEFMRTAADGKRIVGINPGSAWATKRLPAEYYAKVAKILHSNGYVIAIFGGPADLEATDKLKSIIDIEFFDYTNKVPFSQIPALIKNIDLLITNDSAPLHIAVSQHTPVVAVFGATVPSQGFAPYDSMSVIVENNDLHCRPCGLHGGNSCPQKHFKCMLNLKPADIAAAAERILDGR